MADSMTVLRKAGPPGTKRNIVVLGDGFTAADQADVQPVGRHDADQGRLRARLLLRGRLGVQHLPDQPRVGGLRREHADVRREGHAVDPSDDTIASETIRNTALGMIFSGSWSHCWLEYGTNTETAHPGRDQQVGAGRQRDPRRPQQPRTTAAAAAAVARTCRWASTGRSSRTSSATASAASPTSTRSTGNYTGGEQGWINLTTITDRATTKWRQFIDPTTPLPTGVGAAARTTTRARDPRPGAATSTSACSRAAAR